MAKPSWILIFVSQLWATWGSLHLTSGSLGKPGTGRGDLPSPPPHFPNPFVIALRLHKEKGLPGSPCKQQTKPSEKLSTV